MAPEVVFVLGSVTGSAALGAIQFALRGRSETPAEIEPPNCENELWTRRLAAENAALVTQMADVRDRLATIERIVTDDTYRLDNEIEQLRSSKRQADTTGKGRCNASF